MSINNLQITFALYNILNYTLRPRPGLDLQRVVDMSGFLVCWFHLKTIKQAMN